MGQHEMGDVFIHEQALCESSDIGPGTRVWAFAHILKGAKIGSNCNICDGVFVENDVTVGDRVTVKNGVQLWDGVTLEDDVFVGPNATFTNDPFPRSKIYPGKFLRTIVRRGASIGANATILPGIEIGTGAMVGAGAVATRSVPPNAIVVGNPARIVGYVNAEELPKTNELRSTVPSDASDIAYVGVGDVRRYMLPRFSDMRGHLAPGEFEKNLPFFPRRYFIVYNVPSKETRGEHAHKICHQFLICTSGSCEILVDNGTARKVFTLDSPAVGIYVPPMIWSAQYNYSADAVLLVFASDPYDAKDYVREYSEFCALVAANRPPK
ncbi:MAG: WxcM-like domain-containing protein [Xanthobacteraceae bacterium]|nr:WxcM-like domain-containing protein [Xanthobacteraceae bacterium]